MIEAYKRGRFQKRYGISSYSFSAGNRTLVTHFLSTNFLFLEPLYHTGRIIQVTILFLRQNKNNRLFL